MTNLEHETVSHGEVSQFTERLLLESKPSTEKERDAKKIEFLDRYNSLLDTHGRGQPVQLLHQAHRGESTAIISAVKRSTPPVQLENGISVVVTEELMTVSDTNWDTNLILVEATNPNIPQLRERGTIFVAGEESPNIGRKESFISVGGVKATIEQIKQGITLADYIENALTKSPEAKTLESI